MPRAHVPFRALWTVLAAAALLPVASAQIPDDPEVRDPFGDCQFAHGNEYADIVAAWIGDEREDAFDVYLALNRWTEALAAFTGFTVQFEHQGVRFGVTALFVGPAAGWEYSNAFVDLETGEVSEFHPAEGSFGPGPPATLRVAFDKGHFPHDQPDNALRNFEAASADFKAFMPFFFAGGEDPPEPIGPAMGPIVFCDYAASEPGREYAFQVGGHSDHGGPATGPVVDASPDPTDEGAPSPAPAGGSSPGVGAALVVAGAACAAAGIGARRR